MFVLVELCFLDEYIYLYEGSLSYSGYMYICVHIPHLNLQNTYTACFHQVNMGKVIRNTLSILHSMADRFEYGHVSMSTYCRLSDIQLHYILNT